MKLLKKQIVLLIVMLLNCSTSYSQTDTTFSSTGGLVDSVKIAITDIRKANAIMLKVKSQDSIIVDLERLIANYDIELSEYKSAYNTQLQVIDNYNDNVQYINNTNKRLIKQGIIASIISFIVGIIL